MAIGIVGRKRGMTRIFTESGLSIPVTVIEAVANKVTRLIDPEMLVEIEADAVLDG